MARSPSPRTGPSRARTLALAVLAAAPMFASCERSTRAGAVPRRPAVPEAARAKSRGELHPDDDPGAVRYEDLLRARGPLSPRRRSYALGALMKSLGNPYYQKMTEGMYSKARELGLSLAVQAGATESDQEGQRAVLEAMLDRRYDAILVSPQTDLNLTPAAAKAREKGVLLVDVDGALLKEAAYYVGPNHYRAGAAAARQFLKAGGGGAVALLQSVEADYAVSQRTKGFFDALAGSSFRVVAQPFCASDLQLALQAAAQILSEHPDLRGFFCSNDIMALGAARAVLDAGRAGRVLVIGRDGIETAHEAIRAGEMTGTVDAFPYQIGRIALEVTVRVLEGQNVPRAVITPQALPVAGSGDAWADGSETD